MAAPTVFAQTCVGVVGEWTFNSDTLVDSSGHGNHGTNVGGNFGPGIVRDAFVVDGTGQYADFGNAPSLNPANAITLSAWCSPVASASSNDSIIDKGYTSHTGPHYQYHWGIGPDFFQFWLALDGQAHPLFAGSWSVGQWYFVVGTYDGETMKLYVNGAIVAELAASGVLTDYGKNMRIGAFSNDLSTSNAAIDEVRIFDRALSADEVELMYNNHCAVYCSPIPTVSISPQTQSTCLGGFITFTATAQGEPPLAFQWRKNGIPLSEFGHYSGTHTAVLSISDADFGDQAAFDVVVSDACRSTTSAAVNLNLCSGVGGCPSPVDVNGDGVVNGLDIQRIVEILLGG